MTDYYLDTSALVKVYVSEPGSDWVRGLVDKKEGHGSEAPGCLLTAVITVAEAAAAFSIIARVGRISREVRDRTFDRFMKTVTSRFQLVGVTAEVVQLAAELTQLHPLKGYDEVQLACGLYFQEAVGGERVLTFVTADENLVAAAMGH